MTDMAAVESGQSFRASMGSGGRWASERLLAAMKAGREFSAKELRTLDVLRKDEWIEYDSALTLEAQSRLRGVADLVAAGLVKTIPNGLGKTVLQYEKVSDIDPAVVSLSGMARGENDRPDILLTGLPLPITHKDWVVDIRTLMASRNRGEGLDLTMARLCARVIAEKIEQMLFLGGPTFGGLPIYGYTNVPNRNLANFEAVGGLWSAAAKTGAQIIADVLTGIALLQGDRMFGPYGIYVPTTFALPLENDFKANGDQTIRDRILKIEGVKFLTVADSMLADHIAIVQMTSDVVELVEGEPLKTVQWDIEGGMGVKFKAMTIQVPLVKQGTYANRSGVCIMGANATGETTPVAPSGGDV
jgi:hypothetical protein